MEKPSAKQINGLMHGVEQDIADNARAIVQCQKQFDNARRTGIPSVGLFKEFYQLIRERAALMRERANVFEMAINNGVRLESHVDDGLTDEQRLQRDLDTIYAN